MPQIIDSSHHSEEAQQVLGRIPSWTIRWGITIIFAIFVGIILGCCLIKYPKCVDGIVTITTNNSPIDIIARSAGNLEKILVSNGNLVNEGEILGVIETSANYTDVLSIDSCLTEISIQPLDVAVFNSKLYAKYLVGELQRDWTSFTSICKKYRDNITRSIIKKKKMLVGKQISKQKDIYHQMKNQLEAMKIDLMYEEKNFRRDSSLFLEKVIPEIEYDESSRRLLQARNSIISFKNQMSSTELSVIKLKQQLIELTIQEEDETLAFEREIQTNMDRLFAQVQSWKLTYLLISPISGKVSFVQKWDEGQFINTGEHYLTVEPFEYQCTVGMVRIPQSGFGKVCIGQKVIVKLDGFPYTEYGMLLGTIGCLSSVPDESANGQDASQYTAIIEFPNGMETTYGKKLRMIQKMEGTAEIIVEDRRLIMRLLDPIVALFKSGI